ncbi:FkbM family methyltransferase [Desulfonatronovibrio magnus]|uniref:FkbM family methyltransferase n=1 Tax=Desulfonatronovibrio magnus TaxID=698827 RepID=UPI000697C05D|nr:FkbM family methyltransferase [Desulfonatronovibrio magnus]
MSAEKMLQEAMKHHQRGKLAQAKYIYEKILTSFPDYGRARLFLALIHDQEGQTVKALEEAKIGFSQIPSPQPPDISNYGIILKKAGRLDEAEDMYRRALDMSPGNTAALSNLATIQLMRGKFDEAEEKFLDLVTKMEDPAPWLNLARIAFMRQNLDQFKEYLDQAEDRDPAHPELHSLRAQLAAHDFEEDKAFELLKKSLTYQPSNRDAWLRLRQLDPQKCDPEVMEILAQRISEVETQDATTLAAAVATCRHQLIWKSLPKLEEQLAAALELPLMRPPTTSATFDLLAANIPQRSHLTAASATWQMHTRSVQRLTPRELPPRTPGKKIKVAIISSDFRQHAGGTMLVGLVENLPKENVEWYAYSNSFDDSSTFRERLRTGFDRFINISKLTDKELAEKIREDQIDILIERNGMTRDTRVLVTACKPCPIQMRFMGLPGTEGAGDVLDYFIGDPWVLHKGNVDGFHEKFLQLPRNYFPNDHLQPDLSTAGTRSDHGLPEDQFVFCSFNNQYKFSPDNFALWCDILNQIQDSVLWVLKPKADALEKRLRVHLESAGINPDRLILAPQLPHENHIARISHADLVLDTWPYNAHTTCCDAVRVGVPVLTLPGETFASRVAASIMDTSDLSEWIVNSPEEYVRKAVEYAGQTREEIDRAKEKVKETYWSSAMPDMKTMGKMFEAMCLQLYDRHAEGKAITHLRLTDEHKLEELDIEPVSVKLATPELDKTTAPQVKANTVTQLGVQIVMDQKVSPMVATAIRNGLYETAETRIADKIVKDGDKVLELGGCIGFMSTYLMLNKKNLHYTVVEANPEMMDKIKQTHELNAVSANVVNCILGSDNEEKTLYINQEIWSTSTIKRQGTIKEVKVPGRSIQDFLDELKPGIILCDIEGGEDELFESLTPQDLESVQVMLIECHSHLIGEKGVQKAIKDIESLGFKMNSELTDRNFVVFEKKISPVAYGKLERFVKDDGSFDYDKYVRIQKATNKNKKDVVWVDESNIRHLARKIMDIAGEVQFGLCHGTRTGMEQKWFAQELQCEVLGTKIGDGAETIENTIQWDFHEVKDEWLNSVDFIYSNSWDHSYDPHKCFKQWARCLRPGGIMLLDHSQQHMPDHANLADPFGATLDELVMLINECGQGEFEVIDVVKDLPVKQKKLNLPANKHCWVNDIKTIIVKKNANTV